MKHLKYFEFYNIISPEEERLNDILDKSNAGEELSPEEKEIFANRGAIPQKTKYVGIPDKLEFDFEKVENQGDELKVFGTLTYDKEQYYGWFTIPTLGEHIGQNLWDFVKGSRIFDPDPEDLYELDSMIQEIEFDFVDN